MCARLYVNFLLCVQCIYQLAVYGCCIVIIIIVFNKYKMSMGGLTLEWLAAVFPDDLSQMTNQKEVVAPDSQLP